MQVIDPILLLNMHYNQVEEGLPKLFGCPNFCKAKTEHAFDYMTDVEVVLYLLTEGL